MKRLEAFVRVSMLEAVKQALEEIGVQGMTCEQVRGYGRQLGRTDKYRGSTYAVNLLPKMKILVFLKDEQLEEAIEAIVQATRTGEIGDGKIGVRRDSRADGRAGRRGALLEAGNLAGLAQAQPKPPYHPTKGAGIIPSPNR
jgi:nitrogen regulatory protein P-II 1